MVNVFEHTKYCGGRGYVMPSYDEASSRERATQRVQTDRAEQSLLGARQAEHRQAQQNLQHDLQHIRPQNIMQGAVLIVARPLTALANMLQNISKWPVPLPAFAQGMAHLLGTRLSQIVSHLISFFFGTKRAQNDDDVEEREKRNLEDVATSDLFTKFVVQESNPSSLGSG